MYLCHFVRRHADVRGNGHLVVRSRRCISSCIRSTLCNRYIGGSAGDSNRSLRSCYFVCVVDERASFASFACAVKVPGDSPDLSVL